MIKSHHKCLRAFKSNKHLILCRFIRFEGLLPHYYLETLSNLFEVLTEGYPKAAISVVEHLAGHQSVEHSCTGKWYTKVEAKQPPYLCISIDLQGNKHM